MPIPVINLGAGLLLPSVQVTVVAVVVHSTVCVANASCLSAGDKRSGTTRVLYDTTFSERGALAAVGRAPRRANPFDVGLPMIIKTPHALPMFREEPGRKRSREKARMVTQQQHPASMPAQTPLCLAHTLVQPQLLI
eukprot:GHRR01036502.1.p2 GENE.GHRR01036502.1~~GHRR01036502.1.p2  ORF type:complete len:137 (-),score=37.53 GHRR01036502.1:798-1208(-)